MKATIMCLGLSACGPLNDGSTAAQLGQFVVDRATGAQAPESPSSAVTQEQILSTSGKYVRVNVRNRDRWDTSVEAGTNAQRATWIDSDSISITFEDGIVVATRGLPGDLLAAETAQVAAAIRAGGGQAQRVHEFLTDMDGISTELLQCRIVLAGSDTVRRLGTSQPATRFEEDCTSDGLQFANVYWVNRAGKVVRSLQAISPRGGYLQIDVF